MKKLVKNKCSFSGKAPETSLTLYPNRFLVLVVYWIKLGEGGWSLSHCIFIPMNEYSKRKKKN